MSTVIGAACLAYSFWRAWNIDADVARDVKWLRQKFGRAEDGDEKMCAAWIWVLIFAYMAIGMLLLAS